MYDAMIKLKAARVRFARCSEHQIKIGRWNFYPNTGKIFEDDNSPIEQTGLKALLEILEPLGLRRQEATSTRDAPSDQQWNSAPVQADDAAEDRPMVLSAPLSAIRCRPQVRQDQNPCHDRIINLGR